MLLLSAVGEDIGPNAVVRMGCMVRSEPRAGTVFFCTRNCSRYEPRISVRVRISVSV